MIYKYINITVHQINTVVGDLEGNTQKIIDKIKNDNQEGIIVFPESAIAGYTCGSLWDKPSFVLKQIDKLKEISKVCKPDKVYIIGFISYHGLKKDGFPRLRNSVAVINNQKIMTYDKQLLANSDHHEDKKYFEAGKETKVFDVIADGAKITIGTPICEDVWYVDHKRNIPEEMVNMGAEILIIPNQSYFYYGKQKVRHDLFSSVAKNNNVPVVTSNSNGVGDILKNIILFDGGSMVFNRYGELICEAEQFSEDTIQCENILNNNDGRVFEEKYKYDEIIEAIVYTQVELFKQFGLKKAQLHLSGGIDSAIVLALLRLAYKPTELIVVTNPTNLNSKSLEMVELIANNLGVKLHINRLQEIYDKFIEVDSESFGGQELHDTGKASVQAVLRTVQGIAASHRFGSGIVATGNHTEIVLGWCSFHDIGSIGTYMPIGDLTKIELYELSQRINFRFGFDAVPQGLFDGSIIPNAELPDSTDGDPIDYWIQSGICAELIRHRKSRRELINDYKRKTLTKDYFPNLPDGKTIYESYTLEEFENEITFSLNKIKPSVYKAGQHAPILQLAPRSRGFSSRETLINKYYE